MGLWIFYARVPPSGFLDVGALLKSLHINFHNLDPTHISLAAWLRQTESICPYGKWTESIWKLFMHTCLLWFVIIYSHTRDDERVTICIFCCSSDTVWPENISGLFTVSKTCCDLKASTNKNKTTVLHSGICYLIYCFICTICIQPFIIKWQVTKCKNKQT